jgi:NADPH:quinone reductase-like Zn-dependent oxidoreductase
VVVDAIGFMFADLIFRAGHYVEQPLLPGAGLGYDACGIVDALGADVTGVAVGDRVSTFHNFSLLQYSMHREVAIIPARSLTVTPVNLSPEEGAGFWNPFLTAYLGLVELGQMKAGDTALVTAATSSVGAAAIQVCKRVGATVIATTRSREKRPRLEAAGADHVIVTSSENLVERVAAITRGAGANVIFDAIAGPEFERFGDVVAVRGKMIVYGALSLAMPTIPLLSMMVKQATVDAFTLFSYTGNEHFHSAERPHEIERAKRFVLDGLALGHLKPVIARIFDGGLDRYREVTRYVESGIEGGKVILRLSSA